MAAKRSTALAQLRQCLGSNVWTLIRLGSDDTRTDQPSANPFARRF